MDVRGVTYETFDDLVVYCRRVAGSIGRLSLGVVRIARHGPGRAAGRRTGRGAANSPTSSATCGRTWPKAACICLARTLRRSPASCAPPLTPTPAFAALIRFQTQRARRQFDIGLQLLPLLDWRKHRLRRRDVRHLPASAETHRAGPGRRDPRTGVAVHRDQGARRAVEPAPRMSRHVVVVGGGLAGCAAALTCADAGARVTLLEARRLVSAGPPTRSSAMGCGSTTGSTCTLRCCTAYRAFIDRIGASAMVTMQRRLAIPVVRPGHGVAWIKRGQSAGPAPSRPQPGNLPASIARRASASGARVDWG